MNKAMKEVNTSSSRLSRCVKPVPGGFSLNRVIALCCLVLVFAPLSAGASTEWASWGAAVGNSKTGSFLDGRTVEITTFYSGSGDSTTGEYTVNPALPGVPSGQNPPFVYAVTNAPHPTVIDPGHLIMTLDLAGFPVDAATVFGMADMMDIMRYRLELLDGLGNPLPLTGIQLAHYNLTYPPASGSLVADYNITLNPATGALRLNLIHDANTGSGYRHSGLTTFTNLPAETATIRILSDSTAQQVSEGLQFYGSSGSRVGRKWGSS